MIVRTLELHTFVLIANLAAMTQATDYYRMQHYVRYFLYIHTHNDGPSAHKIVSQCNLMNGDAIRPIKDM